MPPFLALLCSLFFIAWLFAQDGREHPVNSKALWIPAFWILIISTRPVAYWMPAGLTSGGGVEGNWVDLTTLGLLIISALIALQRREINWGRLVADNKSILLLYLFFLCSIFWAQYPLATFKRVVKDFSVVLFALMLLSEADPSYAIRKLFLRCSYIVFTLSFITIKYFPTIGTNQSHAHDNMFTGLTTQKNTLGEVVFTYSMVLIWDMAILLRQENVGWRDKRILIRSCMFAIGMWLLVTCDSQTSLLCLIVGIVLFWYTGKILKTARPMQKLTIAGAWLMVVVALNSTFDLKAILLEAMGRNPTLTGRTEIWDQVLAQPINPIIGTGFLMFFDGPMGQNALDELGAHVSTAHNGYLDIYLDGGLIGLSLLAVMLLARGHFIINQLVNGSYWGRLGFIYWIVAMIHNFSESTFFRFSILWFFLMLSMVKYVPRFGRHPDLEPMENS